MVEEGRFGSNDLNILDLGTGNGHFLFELNQEIEEQDVSVNLVNNGIDYSPESVQFARKVAQRKFPDQSYTFEEVDFIKKECRYLQENAGKFDVIFDKGTLDAIALNNDPVEDFDGKIGVEVYPLQVSQLVSTGSLLIITSCNFTEEELTKIITQEAPFKVYEKVEYPSFQFGGQKGSTICTIAFERI